MDVIKDVDEDGLCIIERHAFLSRMLLLAATTAMCA